jgi:hypothetical protein
VAAAFQIEQRGRMISVAEDIRRRLIDRDGAGACHGIRLLAGMQAQRIETEEFGFHRMSLPDLRGQAYYEASHKK